MSRLGSAAMRALFLRTAPVCPFDLRSWRSLLSRWANPFAQQDCAEFLAHVAECLRSSLLAGGWDARVLEDGIVKVVDSGLNSSTISLDLPNTSRIDLQALVGTWHGQHSVHALRFPSQVLILRIARYRQAASGVILKNPCTVTWSRFLSVPAFTDASLTNAMLRYRICAVTYHVGPLLTSGHYTCDLLADGQAWSCDDGAQPPARDCSDAGFEFESQLVYLVWAVLEPSHVDSAVRAAPRPPLAPGHS